MKQKLFIIGALIFLVAVLVGLNAASYVQKEKVPDSELFPNRSSYNAGATGTRVFYDLLNETGRKVVRWQEPPRALLSGKNAPQTFVLIGPVRREFSETESKDILQWVAGGGKLVIIDREPPHALVVSTANWSISISGDGEPPVSGIDPSDAARMTDKIPAAKPVQPTIYTKGINAVQPSKLSSAVIFERFSGEVLGEKQNKDEGEKQIDIDSNPTPPISANSRGTDFHLLQNKAAAPENRTIVTGDSDKEDSQSSPALPQTAPPMLDEEVETSALTAPVVHLSGGGKNILVDVPFGSGHIVFLTDPFIVSNAGINLVDNANLGINIAASRDGLIAFDEYHHGYGTNNNRLVQYFAETPVIPIFLQIALLAALILFSQSRRFARALPETEPNRLSKLEYVSAMAELQQRTKAFDLAVENIYTDFRRRAARAVSADVFTTSSEELARLLAERGKISQSEIASLLQKCEDIMHGAQTNKKEVVQTARRLRELEEKLGLARTKRAKI